MEPLPHAQSLEIRLQTIPGICERRSVRIPWLRMEQHPELCVEEGSAAVLLKEATRALTQRDDLLTLSKGAGGDCVV